VEDRDAKPLQQPKDARRAIDRAGQPTAAPAQPIATPTVES
jgi:hypothetical protein